MPTAKVVELLACVPDWVLEFVKATPFVELHEMFVSVDVAVTDVGPEPAAVVVGLADPDPVPVFATAVPSGPVATAAPAPEVLVEASVAGELTVLFEPLALPAPVPCAAELREPLVVCVEEEDDFFFAFLCLAFAFLCLALAFLAVVLIDQPRALAAFATA
jgi:hypothetical protein